MKTTTMITATALLALGAGCGGGPDAVKVKGPTGPADSNGNAVSVAAANKFNAGLEALVQHDKASDWSDATCTQVAQLFLDAAKEQGDKNFNEAIYNAGLANQRCKKTAEARALFKQVFDKDSKFHRAKVQLAMYAYADSGEKDIDAAISTIREAAVVDAEFKNVEALVNLGMLYIKRNNKNEDPDGKTDLLRAKRFIQSALALDDGYMPAFNQLAILYLETAKDAAGRDSKRKMGASHSKERKVDTQALDLAAVVCSQAIKKNPKYASIHNTAGMIQVELGNLNGAVGEFNNARTIEPAFYEAQMNYAAVNLSFRGFKQAEASVPRQGDRDPPLATTRRAPRAGPRPARQDIDDSNVRQERPPRPAPSWAKAKAARSRPPRYLLQRGDPHPGVQGEVGRQEQRGRAPQRQEALLRLHLQGERRARGFA